MRHTLRFPQPHRQRKCDTAQKSGGIGQGGPGRERNDRFLAFGDSITDGEINDDTGGCVHPSAVAMRHDLGSLLSVQRSPIVFRRDSRETRRWAGGARRATAVGRGVVGWSPGPSGPGWPSPDLKVRGSVHHSRPPGFYVEVRPPAQRSARLRPQHRRRHLSSSGFATTSDSRFIRPLMPPRRQVPA